MAKLRVPIVTVVIGEGGSGGALAIGVCDRLLMLQFSTYSRHLAEGCASILWKSADKKEVAADAMGLTADRLQRLGLIDEVILEPLGGAHRAPTVIAASVGAAIARHLAALRAEVTRKLARRVARVASPVSASTPRRRSSRWSLRSSRGCARCTLSDPCAVCASR
jgi:acetyl-CoA carboxylase carboxyl transferase subunit alpha